jgi:hypothetical protein
MLEWLQGLPQTTVSFLGALAGSCIGLIALLLGALFNAHLNRRRDERLRNEDRRALAAALKAELDGIATSLEMNTEELKKKISDFAVPNIAHSIRVLPALLSKIGLLDTEIIRKVISSHIVIEQYVEHLTLRGGIISGPRQSPNRRLILMTKDKTGVVISLNESISKRLRETIQGLDEYLR